MPEIVIIRHDHIQNLIENANIDEVIKNLFFTSIEEIRKFINQGRTGRLRSFLGR